MRNLAKIGVAALTGAVALAVSAGSVLAQSYDYTYSSDLTAADAAAATTFFGLTTIPLLVCSCIALVGLIFTIMMIVDIAKRPDEQANKILWILLMLFFSPIGAILYYFMVKKKYGPVK